MTGQEGEKQPVQVTEAGAGDERKLTESELSGVVGGSGIDWEKTEYVEPVAEDGDIREFPTS